MAQAQLPVGYPLTTAITYFNLCKNLMETDAAITWFQRLKLLPSSKWCSCGRGMHLVNRKGCSDGVTWRCPRKGCRKELSLRGGTFFEGYLFYYTICLWCSSFLGSHLSLSTFCLPAKHCSPSLRENCSIDVQSATLVTPAHAQS